MLRIRFARNRRSDQGVTPGPGVAIITVVRSLLLAAALVVASAWGVVHQLPEGEAQAEPHASRPQQIESVSLDGRYLPLAALRDALTTRAGDQLDEAKLAHDRAAMVTALQERGFLAAKVGAAHVGFDEDGGAFVTFAIDQGPMFHVRSVTVTGATANESGVQTLAAGEVASPVHFEEARQALATRLAARGKPATVTLQTTTDDAAGAVDVTLVATR
jgi:outer membrane protein assembly factor BamA